MNRARLADPAAIVIFGASGDLTRRKLIPALHTLACDGLLHPQTQVVGVARTPLSGAALSEQFYEGVSDYARLKPGVCELWPEFERKIFYLAGSYDDAATYRRLGQRLAQMDAAMGTGGNRLFYLATPPSLYPLIVQHLGQVGLNRSPAGWTRIVIEKPFGRDLESAHLLNQQVHAVFDESQVYRIDHYLGKETVQNLLTLRFANAVFEPLWNRNYLDHVQITAIESVGVEHRAGYYDQAGVLRDMLQSHVLQLLTLTALEPPSAFNARALRDEKVKVLQAVRPIALDDGVWGQYRGYRDERGVAPGSNTPTYIALKLYVDNWRWQGVPFYLRSGKKLAQKATEITLQFKPVPHSMFAQDAGLAPNRLSLSIQPDEGLHLCIETKIPGAGMRAAPVVMDFHFGEQFGAHSLPEAYERLLLDAVQGDASLFARSDEIELAWQLVDPLMGKVTPELYEPGSWGPPAADALLAQRGREWTVGSRDAHK